MLLLAISDLGMSLYNYFNCNPETMSTAISAHVGGLLAGKKLLSKNAVLTKNIDILAKSFDYSVFSIFVELISNLCMILLDNCSVELYTVLVT